MNNSTFQAPSTSAKQQHWLPRGDKAEGERGNKGHRCTPGFNSDADNSIILRKEALLEKLKENFLIVSFIRKCCIGVPSSGGIIEAARFVGSVGLGHMIIKASPTNFMMSPPYLLRFLTIPSM